MQRSLYTNSLDSSAVSKLIHGLNTDSRSIFTVLSTLRKLCNHPCLVLAAEDDEEVGQTDEVLMEPLSSSHVDKSNFSFFTQIIASLDIKPDNYSFDKSSKMAVVERMLGELSKAKSEKVVIVSNFTKTLDMLQQLCDSKRYQYLRLDGSTATNKRQELVEAFNRPYSPSCEQPRTKFLLATK